MSAFMVEDKTINRIVTKLKKHLDESYPLRKSLRAIDMDMNTDAQGNIILENYDRYIAEFANSMFDLNKKSIEERYGRGEPEKFRTLNFTYVPEYNVSSIQVLKSLQCYLYQACEGQCVYNPLYVFLNDVYKPYLMSQIIYGLSEYDEAEWA